MTTRCYAWLAIAICSVLGWLLTALFLYLTHCL